MTGLLEGVREGRDVSYAQREDKNTHEILDEKAEDNKTTWHSADGMIIFKSILRKVFGEMNVVQNRV